mgnify:FL=1
MLFISCNNRNPKEKLKDWDEIVLDLEVPSRNQPEINVDSAHFLTKELRDSI